MKRRGWILAACLTAALLGGARADRTTDVLDGLETVLNQRAEENGGDDKKLAKLLAQSLKQLGKDTKDLAAELELAAGVLGTLQKKFAGDEEIEALITEIIDHYFALVQAEIDALAEGVDGLPAAKPTPKLAGKALSKAQSLFQKATTASTAKSVLQNLLNALKTSAKGQKIVTQLNNGGGGGGGGGTLCGPQFYQSPTSLLRVRASGESMTATVGSSSFTADSFVAARSPFLPTAILIGGFQCSPQIDIEFTIPMNPPLNTEMTTSNQPLVGASSANCFECLQTVAGNIRITITEYDANGGRISGTFEFDGHDSVTGGSFTVKSWRTQ